VTPSEFHEEGEGKEGRERTLQKERKLRILGKLASVSFIGIDAPGNSTCKNPRQDALSTVSRVLFCTASRCMLWVCLCVLKALHTMLGAFSHAMPSTADCRAQLC